MAKLPVIDNAEREDIRARLKRYMEQHGIGAPRLFERMDYALDGIDKHYVDLRSLQRFLRNEVRTDDEKVIRYRRFLALVAPDITAHGAGSGEPSFEDIFAETVRKRTILPTAVSSADDPDRLVPMAELTGRKPLEAYEGRYAVTERSYSTEPVSDAAANVHWLLMPRPDGKSLQIFTLVRECIEGFTAPSPDEAIFKPVSANALMVPFGTGELLVMNLLIYGGGNFTLLRDISSTQTDGTLILEGASLAAQSPWEPYEPVTTLRLVRLAGPSARAGSCQPS